MTHYQQLKEQVPAPGAHASIEWSWLLHAFPGLALLSACPQDPYYHAEGDVWTHTIMVVTELVCGADYAAATADERFVLLYAALLHDLSKPGTTVVDEATGRIGQPGHSRRGAIDARVLLWRAAVPFALREAICRIISTHQVPFFCVSGNRSGQSGQFVVRKLSHELDLRLLAAVAEADMRGRHYEKKADCLVDIELFRELAREEGCYGQPYRFADPATRTAYCRGAQIAPDYPFYEVPGSQVTVLAGLPASGKNSWVAQHARGLPVISFDDVRAELGLRHGVGSGAAVHLATDRARALLRAKTPFVFNACHISALLRRKTLDLLYDYGAQVEMVYLEQPPEVIFSRNAKRDSTLSNRAIEAMLLRWEVPLPTEAHQVRYEACVQPGPAPARHGRPMAIK